MKILLVSTPISILGSGKGGGVERVVNQLCERFETIYDVTVLAPIGSMLNSSKKTKLIEIPGLLVNPAQAEDAHHTIALEVDSVLCNLWKFILANQSSYDRIISFSYDWYSYAMGSLIKDKVFHYVSMSALSDTMRDIVVKTAGDKSKSVAMVSKTQALTYDKNVRNFYILGSGVDLKTFSLNTLPNNHIAWVGRISPEKGLGDAITVAVKTGYPLKIFGMVEDQEYFKQVMKGHNRKSIRYEGYIRNPKHLAREIGQCFCTLMPIKWEEAFGKVAIESMATGTPVIAYQRGALSEIIIHGENGFLVKPNNIEEMSNVIEKTKYLDRKHIRSMMEKMYSLDSFIKRFELWLKS